MENITDAREKLQVLARDSIAFRLLDVLLTRAPTEEGSDVIARDIIDASTEPDGFDQLAQFYTIGLLFLPSKFSD